MTLLHHPSNLPVQCVIDGRLGYASVSSVKDAVRLLERLHPSQPVSSSAAQGFMAHVLTVGDEEAPEPQRQYILYPGRDVRLDFVDIAAAARQDARQVVLDDLGLDLVRSLRASGFDAVDVHVVGQDPASQDRRVLPAEIFTDALVSCSVQAGQQLECLLSMKETYMAMGGFISLPVSLLRLTVDLAGTQPAKTAGMLVAAIDAYFAAASDGSTTLKDALLKRFAAPQHAQLVESVDAGSVGSATHCRHAS